MSSVLQSNPASSPPSAERVAKPTVLVVDDARENLQLINALLKQQYHVRLATNGQSALKMLQQLPYPDLILLDIVMEGMDGYEVCRALKQDPALMELPVIFLTARTEVQDEEKGFESGCVDYITKPISPSILKARVATHIQLKAANDILKDNNAYLAAEVIRRTSEVQAVQDTTIMAMASLAETRDNETGMHIKRTQHYVRLVAEYLSKIPKYAEELPLEQIQILFKSAPLHDIGKVGIPDAILLKPGGLSVSEFEIMKTHPALGRITIEHAEETLVSPSSFLLTAKQIAYSHHEKWDGSGYPEGLAGEAIPLSARMMALADVYDALVNKRVYKPAFSHQEATEIIVKGRGSHFDPAIVDAFLDLAEDFQQIAVLYKDTEER
ncbi:HD-GYP domain-containing protein [Synechococcus sp. CS-1328]|uniref:HD-GYP domain-containing protein n=1 Tax=Synechococcus sp. CS-1328 TaxID=2847976 RepID=UPI00223B229C|nr:two-component system response regulator [Synechococcus sp. CS-1328]MCT0224614.1 two-component system response regulator [Synechococcus sp. CS-1328]